MISLTRTRDNSAHYALANSICPVCRRSLNLELAVRCACGLQIPPEEFVEHISCTEHRSPSASSQPAEEQEFGGLASMRHIKEFDWLKTAFGILAFVVVWLLILCRVDVFNFRLP